MSKGRFDRRHLLGLAALLTLILWQVPFGGWILYPFTLFATFVHEMGHGFTALLVGGSFDSFVMHLDGSGLAQVGTSSRISRALVSAGGLVGPSIAGAFVLGFSKNAKRTLLVIGILVLGSTVIFARNLPAFVFGLAMGGSFILVRLKSPERATPFLVQLLGIQLCLAAFRDIDYMFSSGGMVGGRPHPSDSQAIADALFLPYWFWGGLVAVFSLVVLAIGLKRAVFSRA